MNKINKEHERDISLNLVLRQGKKLARLTRSPFCEKKKRGLRLINESLLAHWLQGGYWRRKETGEKDLRKREIKGGG